jgi:quercetin dioxygenase-like cupin family protein
MGRKLLVGTVLLMLSVFLLGQTASTGSEGRILVNPEDTKWEPANAGSESITLREDSKTGATELLAHYPAGYSFPAHWHDANERIILIEGQLALEEDGGKKLLNPGGYAYLPARQVQHLSCVSNLRCSFYVYWDGSPKSHRAVK